MFLAASILTSRLRAACDDPHDLLASIVVPFALHRAGWRFIAFLAPALAVRVVRAFSASDVGPASVLARILEDRAAAPESGAALTCAAATDAAAWCCCICGA